MMDKRHYQAKWALMTAFVVSYVMWLVSMTTQMNINSGVWLGLFIVSLIVMIIYSTLILAWVEGELDNIEHQMHLFMADLKRRLR